MLPNSLCGICQWLNYWHLVRKRTTKLPQDEVWVLLQGLEVRMDILQQCGKSWPLMIMGDVPSRPTPEPLDPVSVGIIRGCINDPQVLV